MREDFNFRRIDSGSLDTTRGPFHCRTTTGLHCNGHSKPLGLLHREPHAMLPLLYDARFLASFIDPIIARPAEQRADFENG